MSRIKVPHGSYSNYGRGGSRPGKIPKSIADLMAMNHMSMEESNKKESFMNGLNDSTTEPLRRSGQSSENSMVEPNPTWEPSTDVNESLW